MSNTASEPPPGPTLAPDMRRDEVIATFMPDYKATCERLKAEHGEGFHRHIEGEVPGLTGPYEPRALSWLGIEVSQVAHAERIAAALKDGWVEADDLTDDERQQRHPLVVLAGRGKDCTHPSRTWGVALDPATEWIEIPDALIRFDPAHNTPTTVVPKGSRVNGTKVTPLRVLVKRAPGTPEALELFTPATS